MEVKERVGSLWPLKTRDGLKEFYVTQKQGTIDLDTAHTA